MQEMDIDNYDLSSYSTLEERERWYLTQTTGISAAGSAQHLGCWGHPFESDMPDKRQIYANKEF